MTVALDPELPANRLSHLIVADIAPSRGALSSEFQGYVQAMQKIEEAGVKTRQEADRVLKPYEQVRLFRVRPCTEPTEVTHCLLGCHDARISVDEPRASLCAPPSSSQVSYTARYPGEINTRYWWLSLGTRRTVFRETNAVHQRIKEQVSTELYACVLPSMVSSCMHCVRYINRHNIDTAKAFFPNMVLEELNAGHWGKLANTITTKWLNLIDIYCSPFRAVSRYETQIYSPH